MAAAVGGTVVGLVQERKGLAAVLVGYIPPARLALGRLEIPQTPRNIN
jgi:hypothetical protein